eukprot:360117-Chlamydomonas_euryale.AAC.7
MHHFNGAREGVAALYRGSGQFFCTPLYRKNRRAQSRILCPGQSFWYITVGLGVHPYTREQEVAAAREGVPTKAQARARRGKQGRCPALDPSATAHPRVWGVVAEGSNTDSQAHARRGKPKLRAVRHECGGGRGSVPHACTVSCCRGGGLPPSACPSSPAFQVPHLDERRRVTVHGQQRDRRVCAPLGVQAADAAQQGTQGRQPIPALACSSGQSV